MKIAPVIISWENSLLTKITADFIPENDSDRKFLDEVFHLKERGAEKTGDGKIFLSQCLSEFSVEVPIKYPK